MDRKQLVAEQTRLDNALWAWRNVMIARGYFARLSTKATQASARHTDVTLSLEAP